MSMLRRRLSDALDKIRPGSAGPSGVGEGRRRGSSSGVAAATDIVHKCTSDMLIGTDWALNMDLVDLINQDIDTVGREVLRTFRKKLSQSTMPKVQLLSLTLLDTCVKNCGQRFHSVLSASAILDDMDKMVGDKKKTDMLVKEKVLMLVQEWGEALGGMYQAAYRGLLDKGMDFPGKDVDSMAPIVTPPQSHETEADRIRAADEEAIRVAIAEVESENQAMEMEVNNNSASSPHGEGYIPPLDLPLLKEEMAITKNSAEVLSEMMKNINMNDPTALTSDGLIEELVGQCKEMNTRLRSYVGQIEDEEMLGMTLSLNDNLEVVLNEYNELLRKMNVLSPVTTSPVTEGYGGRSLPPPAPGSGGMSALDMLQAPAPLSPVVATEHDVVSDASAMMPLSSPSAQLLPPPKTVVTPPTGPAVRQPVFDLLSGDPLPPPTGDSASETLSTFSNPFFDAPAKQEDTSSPLLLSASSTTTAATIAPPPPSSEINHQYQATSGGSKKEEAKMMMSPPPASAHYVSSSSSSSYSSSPAPKSDIFAEPVLPRSDDMYASPDDRRGSNPFADFMMSRNKQNNGPAQRESLLPSNSPPSSGEDMMTGGGRSGSYKPPPMAAMQSESNSSKRGDPFEL